MFPSSAKITNEWSCMSVPPICHYGVQMYNFTFYSTLLCDNLCPHLCKSCLCDNPVLSLVSNDCNVRLDRVLNNFTLKQRTTFFNAAF
jgi:hypothetical protein